MSKVVSTSFRLPPQGFSADVVGLVTFTYKPEVTDPPVRVTRYVKPKNDQDKGREYPIVDVVGATAVKVHDAQVRLSKTPAKSGEAQYWTSAGGVEVPLDVLREVSSEFALWSSHHPAAAGGAGR